MHFLIRVKTAVLNDKTLKIKVGFFLLALPLHAQFNSDGLLAVYYDSSKLTSPAVTEVDPNISYGWGKRNHNWLNGSQQLGGWTGGAGRRGDHLDDGVKVPLEVDYFWGRSPITPPSK